MGAVPGSDLASVREEIQQLKAAVEVLTNATHLMAIPAANTTLPQESGELDPVLCCVLCCAVLCCAVLCCAALCCRKSRTSHELCARH